MFETISPQILLLGGLALAALVLMRKLRSLTGDRANKPALAEPSPLLRASSGSERPWQDKPADFLQWQVEMHQTARELKAEIDSKIVALQAVTRLAREEHCRLELSIARARCTPLGAELADPKPDTLELLQRLADQTATPADLPAVLLSPAAPTDPQQATAIHSLARVGRSAPQIARELALPLGDIELALSFGNPATGAKLG